MCDRCSLSCVVFLFIVALELLLIVFFFLSLYTLFLSLIRKAAPFQTIVFPSFMSVIAVCHLKAQLNSCARLLCVSGLSTTTHIYVCMSVYVCVRVFAFGCTWCFFFFHQQQQKKVLFAFAHTLLQCSSPNFFCCCFSGHAEQYVLPTHYDRGWRGGDGEKKGCAFPDDGTYWLPGDLGRLRSNSQLSISRLLTVACEAF